MSAPDHYEIQQPYYNEQQLEQVVRRSTTNTFYALSQADDPGEIIAFKSNRTNAIKSRLLLWALFLFIICNCSPSTVALELQPTTTKNGEIVKLPPLYDMRTDDDNIAQYAEEPTTENPADPPSEVQKAVCTVTAGEVRASAEAVTTKTLKGVCSAADMNLAFHSLERSLYKELQEIKLLLQQLNLQNGNILPVPQAHEATVETVETSTRSSILKLQSIAPAEHVIKAPEKVSTAKISTPPNTSEDLRKTPVVPQLKSLPVAKKVPQREQEVFQFNNTLLSDQDFKVFTYYWKLENLTERIESAESVVVESPIFSIEGKTLHIRAYFRHLHRDFLYLQLAYAKLKHSNRNNIILDTGGLFKQITSDKVSFKHKISILDQNNQRAKDLVSQQFSSLETTGFLIPNSALLAYVKRNALLIQIFLYL